MSILIIKLGATGDVVRTTPLLRKVDGKVTWITTAGNAVLLQGLKDDLRCISWEERERALDTQYDLAINLEDTLNVAHFLHTVRCDEIFGAYADSGDLLRYTENSKRWFDLSLISSYGRQQADQFKYLNRDTYQEMIFSGLGFRFVGDVQKATEPQAPGPRNDMNPRSDTGPRGDIADLRGVPRARRGVPPRRRDRAQLPRLRRLAAACRVRRD